MFPYASPCGEKPNTLPISTTAVSCSAAMMSTASLSFTLLLNSPMRLRSLSRGIF